MKPFIPIALIILACSAASLSFPSTGHAANPLITGDAVAQGNGKFQFDFNPGYGSFLDPSNPLATRDREMKFYSLVSGNAGESLGHGPYSLQSLWMNGRGEQREEWKWFLFQEHGFGFALKPGVAFHEESIGQGMGAQSRTQSLSLVGSKEIGPWAFRLNAGYIRNENDMDERKDLWHFSLAGGLRLSGSLRLVGQLGMERSPWRNPFGNEAFLSGGAVYSFGPWLDLDMGIKAGFNEFETDWAVLTGFTIRF